MLLFLLCGIDCFIPRISTSAVISSTLSSLVKSVGDSLPSMLNVVRCLSLSEGIFSNFVLIIEEYVLQNLFISFPSLLQSSFNRDMIFFPVSKSISNDSICFPLTISFHWLVVIMLPPEQVLITVLVLTPSFLTCSRDLFDYFILLAGESNFLACLHGTI